MSLADYLAKNYLSDRKRSKKQKTEKRAEIVQNEPITGSQTSGVTKVPIAREPTEQKTKKKKEATAGWKVVGTDEVVTRSNEPLMASGARAGLQTGAQVAEQIRLKQEKELEMLRKSSAEGMGKDADTVYRDASGTRVDMKSRLEERKRKREQEEDERERRKREINMGLVQKLEMEQRRKQLVKASTAGLSRYADDVELNQKLRSKDHDDDPMLSFNPSKSKKYISKTGRKLYRGSYPENRFQIPPGHRWDGVDRSNGFEKSYFKKQQELERAKTLSYTMQDEL